MNKRNLACLLLSGLILIACSKDTTEQESLAPGEIDKWNDPNFEIIGVGAYNYTDHDIYDVFLLPPDKSDIKFAAVASVGVATPHNAERWGLKGASGANLAWDYRWTTPRKFKAWWFRIVDMRIYSANASKYDKYTTKEAAPGAAWCEGEIQVTQSPIRERNSDLIIHYYPDGHIEGDVVQVNGDSSKVDIKRRDQLPRLEGRACLKEIPNPYFGKKKPIPLY